MKKLFGILSVIVLFVMISCEQGIKQEDMDKLNVQIVENETTIALLQEQIDQMTINMEAMQAKNDSLIALTAPKTGKTTTAAKPKPTTNLAKPTTTTTTVVTPTDKERSGTTPTDQKKRN
jgi:uncharacterized coiled-coil protein SlyX